jgi:hypothetical protein
METIASNGYVGDELGLDLQWQYDVEDTSTDGAGIIGDILRLVK